MRYNARKTPPKAIFLINNFLFKKLAIFLLTQVIRVGIVTQVKQNDKV